MPRQTRNARLLLMRAARAVLIPEFGPAFGTHFVEGDPPAGGGANPPKKEEPSAPKKLEMTEDELQARIKSALDAKSEADAKAKKTADDAAAAEDARKKGEFEKVANSEKEKREQAERDNASLRIDIAIRDHLADEKLRDYAGCAKYIKPLIDSSKASDQTKLANDISAAVSQYVKDNPRAAKGSPPVPPGRSGGKGTGDGGSSHAAPRTAEERQAKFLDRYAIPDRFKNN